MMEGLDQLRADLSLVVELAAVHRHRFARPGLVKAWGALIHADHLKRELDSAPAGPDAVELQVSLAMLERGVHTPSIFEAGQVVARAVSNARRRCQRRCLGRCTPCDAAADLARRLGAPAFPGVVAS